MNKLVTLLKLLTTALMLEIISLLNFEAFAATASSYSTLKPFFELKDSLCPQSQIVCYKPLPLETKNNIYLFLMIGSSNMMGRAMPRHVDSIPDPHVISMDMKYGGWKNTIEPAMPNATGSTGQGCALAFGKRYAALHPDRYIGLLCCGQDGAGLNAYAGNKFGLTSAWGPIFGLDNQGDPTGVNLVDFATKQGYHVWGGLIIETLPLGIETNAFETKLIKIIDSVRVWLNEPDLPVIIPEPAPFESAYLGAEAADVWMKTVHTLSQKVKNSASIRTDDCRSLFESQERDATGTTGDQNHFDYMSNVKIGERFAETFSALESANAGVTKTVFRRHMLYSQEYQPIVFFDKARHSFLSGSHYALYDLQGRLASKAFGRNGVWIVSYK
jgi:hypothetical protein